MSQFLIARVQASVPARVQALRLYVVVSGHGSIVLTWRPSGSRTTSSYNSAISACEKGQQSEQALSLVLEMWTSHPALDVVSYSSAISARKWASSGSKP